MSYEVEASPTAKRQLARIPEKARAAVLETMESLGDNPQRKGNLLGAELKGFLSARRGEFRVVSEIDEERQLVKVQRIGHRRDVYRPR